MEFLLRYSASFPPFSVIDAFEWLWMGGLHKNIQLMLDRSSRPEVFCKRGVLKNIAKFTGEHLCQSLFFNKVVAAWDCEFCEIFKSTFFIKHLRWLLKSPFSVLHFSYYTLMTFLMMLCVILLFMLMIQLYSKFDQASDLWQQLELALKPESDLQDTVDGQHFLSNILITLFQKTPFRDCFCKRFIFNLNVT